MFIISKDGLSLINLARVESIYIREKSKTINASFPNGGGCHIATYEKTENCKFALEALYNAIASEDKTFYFPDERDMETAKQHRQYAKTKSSRRGGS